MRYGIFSDIHGNLEALQAVLEAYAAERIEAYICLGDVVGYGANPNECCDIVRSLTDKVILGNHDAVCCQRMGAEWFNPVARAAVEWCTRVLKPEHLRWLQQLPYQIREEGMLFCHGSPYRQEEFPYLFSPAQAREVFLHVPDLPPLTFVGHTHRPITFFSPLTSRTEIDVITDDTFTVTPQNRYIINVGSVGQPRDGDWRACYALFDSESRECRMVRVEYDVEQAYEKIRQAGLPRQLGERLFYGM